MELAVSISHCCHGLFLIVSLKKKNIFRFVSKYAFGARFTSQKSSTDFCRLILLCSDVYMQPRSDLNDLKEIVAVITPEEVFVFFLVLSLALLVLFFFSVFLSEVR